MMRLLAWLLAEERLAALAQPCGRCNGKCLVWNKCEVGQEITEKSIVTCPECNGTKTASVPGCRLDPRGESVVVK